MHVRIALAVVTMMTFGAVVHAAAATPSCPDTSRSATHGSAQEFDFLVGSWSVHNRRLKQRLTGSHEWGEFDAADTFAKLPGNLGTDEHYTTAHWSGYTALGLHLYDPEHRMWTLYWGDNRNAPGTLQTLAKGAFVDGIGVFCAPDTFNGKPITVRILWRRIDADHARWEQAFSTNRGTSWETNWTMDFTRAPARDTH